MFDINNDLDEIDNNDLSDATSSESVKSSSAENDSQFNATLEELVILKDKFSRLTADFQNYKKRAESDKYLLIDRSRSEVLLAMLSIVDNFDRALLEAQANQNEALHSWLVGFELIHKALYEFLASQKVTVIAEVTTFDPNIHEAIMQVQDDAYASGSIVKVFEKGFMYKDQVLRTAKVSVAA